MSTAVRKENFKILKHSLEKPGVFLKKGIVQGSACYSYNYTKYGCMGDWETAWQYLKELPDNENIFHELIFGNRPVKPYLDIEWYESESRGLSQREAISGIKSMVIEIFSKEWGYTLDEEFIKIGFCHRKKGDDFKNSFRLVVSTQPAVVFADTNAASYLARRVNTMFMEKYDGRKVIDLGVYKRLQNIRFIGHSKAGEKAPIIKNNGYDNDLDFVITNIKSGFTVIEVPEQRDDMYENIKGLQKVGDGVVDVFVQKVKNIHPTAELIEFDANGFLQFNYKDRNELCFTGDARHDKIGFFGFVKDDVMYIGCHSGKCVDDSGKKIISTLGAISRKNSGEEVEPVGLNNEFNICDKTIKECVFNGSRGMSDLFACMYKEPRRILFFNERENTPTVYYWDGKLWRPDDTHFMHKFIPSILSKVLLKFENNQNALFSEEEGAALDVDTAVVKKSQKLREKMNELTNVPSILKCLHSTMYDAHFGMVKDITPYLLSVVNGVIDLRTGDIRDCVPGDNITRAIGVEYKKDACYKIWDDFVRQISANEEGPDNDMYNYLRWTVGYGLQGKPVKKLFFLFYGEKGYNGKSLFLNTIKNVLGFYAVSMDKSVIVDGPKKSGGSHSTEICQLENARFGILSETREDDVINDGQVKMLTGVTDKLSVREIYGRQKEFTPTFVPFISSNHKIKINLSDRAMYERTVPIPFKLSFVENPTKTYERKGDTGLAEKLDLSKEGILRWLVECSVYYHENQDMKLPKAVIEAKEEYRKEMDEYADFINERYIYTGDSSDYIEWDDVKEEYRTYCAGSTDNATFRRKMKVVLNTLSGVSEKKMLPNGKIHKWKLIE